VSNEFTYSGFWLYLDLNELDHVFSGRWLWSTRRTAVARFRREDHLLFPDDVIPDALIHKLPGSSRPTDMSLGRQPKRDSKSCTSSLPPLDTCVRDLVEATIDSRPTGPIRLLTQPRYFGYGMNPVSFYYCFDEADESVEAIVAEVNNTPWRERHCYVLTRASRTDASSVRLHRTDAPCVAPAPTDEASVLRADSPTNAPPIQIDNIAGQASNSSQERLRFRHGKRFHVSPFMQMDMDYDWSVTSPGKTLAVHIENWQDGTRLLDCTLNLKRHPINGFELAKSLCRFPFMTAKIVAAIHWQALRLWWKGCPYIPHPGMPEPTLAEASRMVTNIESEPNENRSQESRLSLSEQNAAFVERKATIEP